MTETRENIIERATREARERADNHQWRFLYECGYIAGVIAEADRRAKDRELLQMAADALNGSVWPNAISADELALLAMNNAGSQKSIDRARSIANDHRSSQEASRAALSALKDAGITPTT